jgi:hypothetical protein
MSFLSETFDEKWFTAHSMLKWNIMERIIYKINLPSIYKQVSLVTSQMSDTNQPFVVLRSACTIDVDDTQYDQYELATAPVLPPTRYSKKTVLHGQLSLCHGARFRR